MKNKIKIGICSVICFIVSFLLVSNIMKEEPIIYVDTLPITDQYSIQLRLDEYNRKEIRMSFETYQYVTKKKAITKQSVKDIESLFKRLEDK